MSATTGHDCGITTAEAARRLGTTEATIQQMCAAKILPACKLFRRWRVSEQGLAAYLRGEKPVRVKQPTPVELMRRRAASAARPVVGTRIRDNVMARGSK